MIKISMIVIILANFTQAGEWLTRNRAFCIDKCKYHDDNYNAYWCHVADQTLKWTDGELVTYVDVIWRPKTVGIHFVTR